MECSTGQESDGEGRLPTCSTSASPPPAASRPAQSAAKCSSPLQAKEQARPPPLLAPAPAAKLSSELASAGSCAWSCRDGAASSALQSGAGATCKPRHALCAQHRNLKHPQLWWSLGCKAPTWASGARAVWAGCRNPAATMTGHVSAIRSSEATTNSAARCNTPLRSPPPTGAAAPAASSSAAQWVAHRVRACIVAGDWTLRRATKLVQSRVVQANPSAAQQGLSVPQSWVQAAHPRPPVAAHPSAGSPSRRAALQAMSGACTW